MRKSLTHSFEASPGAVTRSSHLPKRAQQQAIRVAEVVVARPGESVQLRVGDAVVELPNQLVSILRVIAVATGSGEEVTLIVGDQELSSQQAADILNVSRPHVVKLAHEGVLPFSKVGNRHRFAASDVAAYKVAEDRRRDEALGDLAREGGEYTSEDF